MTSGRVCGPPRSPRSLSLALIDAGILHSSCSASSGELPLPRSSTLLATRPLMVRRGRHGPERGSALSTTSAGSRRHRDTRTAPASSNELGQFSRAHPGSILASVEDDTGSSPHAAVTTTNARPMNFDMNPPEVRVERAFVISTGHTRIRPSSTPSRGWRRRRR